MSIKIETSNDEKLKHEIEGFIKRFVFRYAVCVNKVNDSILLYNPLVSEFHKFTKLPQSVKFCTYCSIYKDNCMVCDNRIKRIYDIDTDYYHFQSLGKSLYVKSLFAKSKSSIRYLTYENY